jgi:uncharacterized glyoxalase superfamily protein PhnB
VRKSFDDFEPAVSRIHAVAGPQSTRLFKDNHITTHCADISFETVGEVRDGQQSFLSAAQQPNPFGRQEGKKLHRILKGCYPACGSRPLFHIGANQDARRMVMVKLSRIAPEIPVSNLKESVNYYEQKLGFRVAMEMPGGNYTIVERDDIAIHLFQADAQTPSPVGIHIFTEELEALHTELKNRGARISQEILRKPWGNRDFRVHDDSGNQLKFTEPLSSDE